MGDSSQTSAAPSVAATTAAVSVMSTQTGTTAPRASRSRSRPTVPVYECRGATTTPPVGTRSSTAPIAAMPEPKETQVPPSRSPSAVSNAVQVGLP